MHKKEFNGNHFERILQQVAENVINTGNYKEVKIFLDIAGGLRNLSILLQQLTKLLEYYGYKTEAYYTSYNAKDNKQNRFHSCKNSYEQMAILDAVNEFIIKGSSVQLKNIFGHLEYEPVKELLSSLEEFSNAIQICLINNLSEILNNMNTALNKLENSEINGDNIFALRLMIPLIRKKFFLYNTDYDYTGIVKWCLSNGYIQQALTIYTEKIPEYIFKSGILTASESRLAEAEEEVEKNTNKSDPYAVMFYEKILSNVKVKKSKVNMSDEIRKYFCYGNNIRLAVPAEIESIPDERIKIFMQVIADMQDNFNPNNYSRQRNLKGSKYLAVNNFINPYRQQTNSFKAFINTLCTNNNKISEFLFSADVSTPKSNKSAESTYRKLENISTFTIECLPDGFSTAISAEEIKSMLYDYAYIKLVRNQINHAKKMKCLSKDVHNIYMKRGIDIDDFSPAVLEEHIHKFLAHLKSLADNVKK